MTLLDTVGCAKGAAIETYTGRLVDITNIQPQDIRIADIAHSLSMQARFNGHARRFISVAEHCCNVADFVWREMDEDPQCADAALAALLHDGSEAFICDVPRPIKPLLSEYAELESQVQAAIHARFNLVVLDDLHAIIKRADNVMLKAESQQLMASCGETWGMDQVEIANIRIQCWTPEIAEQEFLIRFNRWY